MLSVIIPIIIGIPLGLALGYVFLIGLYYTIHGGQPPQPPVTKPYNWNHDA